MSLIEVKVPDIGDFKDVPVIGIEVSPGDTVKAEDPLVTLESDKADMLVLGGGPGGYSAAFRAADLGLNTVLVERYAALGGVCLNVGCIPSKALLHVAAVMDERGAHGRCTASRSPPEIDLDALRAHKDKVVGKLTGGLAGMAKARKVRIVRGVRPLPRRPPPRSRTDRRRRDRQDRREEGHPLREMHHRRRQQRRPPALHPDDPRIVDSTGALELRFVPKRMLVIGGGIIGLEMARCTRRSARRSTWSRCSTA
jgi:dihydrolipoamide dehydrogenase